MSDDNKQGDIIMLPATTGPYPFYTKQPTEMMRKLFTKYEVILRQSLGDDVVGVYRMGSAAIVGMPGSAMVDILLVMKNAPPTEEQMGKLKELNIGLIGDGNSPHHPDDTWFQNLAFPPQDNFDEYLVNGEHPPDGYLGRLTLHFSPFYSPWVRTVLAFVDYLTKDKEAFERYADVKIEGAKIQSSGENERGGISGKNPFIRYKMYKGEVAKQLLDEAERWREEGNFELPQAILDCK